MRLPGVVAILWLCVGSAAAATEPCGAVKIEEELRVYLKEKDPSSCTILVFDHLCRRWYSWNYTGCPRCHLEKNDDFDSSGERPQLWVESKKCFKVLVVHTNPLLFNVAETGAAEVDIEELANLRALALSIGSIAGTALQSIPSGTGPPGASSRRELKIVAAEYERRAAFVRQDLESLKATATGLASAIATIDRRVQTTVARIQEAESGEVMHEGIAYTTQEMDSVSTLFERAAQLLEAMHARGPMGEKTATVVSALGEALRTPAAKPEDKEKRERTIADLRSQMDPSIVENDGCREPDGCAGCQSLCDGLATLRTFTVEEAKQYPSDFEAARVFAAAGNARLEALAKLQDLYIRRVDVTKTAASLRLLHERAASREYGASGDAQRQSLTWGIVPLQRTQGDVAKVKWSKYRTETFKIERDPGLKDRIAPRHPDVSDLKYDLHRKSRFGFGVNLGLTYTPMIEPKWAAVTDAADTSGTVVGRVDEESRAGRVALLLQAEPLQWWRKSVALGVELGTTVDTANPGLFIGPVLRVRIINVGGGLTIQRNKKLDGQFETNTRGHAATRVASADEIRTSDVWAKDWYVSLTLAVDELPFFKN